MRWNIKLIDFGFARPLRREDIKHEDYFKPKQEPDIKYFGRSTVNGQLDNKSLHQSSFGLNNSGHSGSNHSLHLSNSVSRIKVLDLSAVGNRTFAAPEVKKAHKYEVDSKDKIHEEAPKQEPLTEFVSDYGMIADAFSAGATIRYMCTGVPPDKSISEYLQEHYDPIVMLCRLLCRCVANGQRQKRYKQNSQLPQEATRLILGLTHWNESKRTTIRSARDYKWISTSYTMENSEGYPFTAHGNLELDFLKCAM